MGEFVGEPVGDKPVGASVDTSISTVGGLVGATVVLIVTCVVGDSVGDRLGESVGDNVGKPVGDKLPLPLLFFRRRRCGLLVVGLLVVGLLVVVGFGVGASVLRLSSSVPFVGRGVGFFLFVGRFVGRSVVSGGVMVTRVVGLLVFNTSMSDC